MSRYFKGQEMEQVQEELFKKCATYSSTEIIQIKVCFAKLQRKLKFQISYCLEGAEKFKPSEKGTKFEKVFHLTHGI